jgi:hypothetical protein
MKILQLDNNYFRFPEGIKTADEFAEFANNSGQKFVKLTMYSEEHCMEPYFIEEDKRTVWVNLSQITYIEEIDGEVLPRIDYESRLRQVVREKCLDCVNFKGNPDDLDGHYDRLRLDGRCWSYENTSEETDVKKD